MMDARAILKEADTLFTLGKIADAGAYLEEKAAEALDCKEDSAALSILNELTGYYRHSGRMEDAWDTAKLMLKLIEQLKLWNTLDGATALLNIATIYKESHEYEKAMHLYRQVQDIYQNYNLRDVRYLGLMNNMCVTSLMQKDYYNACLYGELASAALNKLSGNPADYERERRIVLENVKTAKEYYQKYKGDLNVIRD